MDSPDETLVSDLATGTISLALLSASVVLHDSVEYLCCCCGVISARDVIKDVLVGDRGFNFPFLLACATETIPFSIETIPPILQKQYLLASLKFS